MSKMKDKNEKLAEENQRNTLESFFTALPRHVTKMNYISCFLHRLCDHMILGHRYRDIGDPIIGNTFFSIGIGLSILLKLRYRYRTYRSTLKTNIFLNICFCNFICLIMSKVFVPVDYFEYKGPSKKGIKL